MRQFFEDGDGRLSMSRLLCFLAFFPAAYVVIRAGSELLTVFLGAFGPGMYGVGKSVDALHDVFAGDKKDAD